MNKDIEKKDILPELDALAKLKQEILSQNAKTVEQPKDGELLLSKKEIQKAMIENEYNQQKNAEKNLEKWLIETTISKERLTASESSEHRWENAPASKSKVVATKSDNFAELEWYGLEGASWASKIWRLKAKGNLEEQIVAMSTSVLWAKRWYAVGQRFIK